MKRKVVFSSQVDVHVEEKQVGMHSFTNGRKSTSSLWTEVGIFSLCGEEDGSVSVTVPVGEQVEFYTKGKKAMIGTRFGAVIVELAKGMDEPEPVAAPEQPPAEPVVAKAKGKKGGR